MKFENTRVFNFEGALRGMRNPKESWSKSDSHFDCDSCLCNDCFYNDTYPCKHQALYIGENDMKLAQNLIRAGSEHRKFMRQIFVSVDITAPLYWWKEFDTYKVGTVANSTSTMHKIASKPITIECFEIDDYKPDLALIDPSIIGIGVDGFVEMLEQLRQKHLFYKDESKNEDRSKEERDCAVETAEAYWKELIRWLPEAWLQTRTVTMNYENLLAICGKGQRRFHKLREWSGKTEKHLPNFISWARTLPYAQEFIFIDEGKE